MRDPYRILALFEPTGLIGNPGLDRFKMGNDFLTNHPPNLLFIPRTVGNELLQPLRINTKPGCQESNALTPPSNQKARDIICASDPPLTPAQRRDHRHHERFESLDAALPESAVPFHSASSCKKIRGIARKYLT